MEIERYIILDDGHLIDMALEGDTYALDQLFRRYRDSIFQLYVNRMGGSCDDAEDLLQETFIKVYLNLNKYNPDYTFGQWIYAIARNTFIDYMRKRRDNMSLDHIHADSAMLPMSVTPTPEESFISSQQRAQLKHHLSRMTPRYSRLIELRFFKDYSYEEIAAELNLPMGTVKTQIHRAREQLCKLITNSEDILP